MKKELEAGSDELNIGNWLHRCALELIGQGGLGYSFDPLTEERPDEYAVALKEFTSVSSHQSKLDQWLINSLRPALFSLAFPRLIWYKLRPLLELIPTSWQRWAVEHTPSKRVQHVKNICDTLSRSSSSVLNMKKNALKAGEESVVKQVGEGKDILSVLRT